MSTQERELVTREELRAWITQRLQMVEDCGECEVAGITPLRGEDEEGCNWSDGLTVRGCHVDARTLRPALLPIVTEARRRFNLKPE